MASNSGQGGEGGSQSGGSKSPQREALEESEKRAADEQPENYKEEETADKVVEIGPEMTDAPIKGIDPA